MLSPEDRPVRRRCTQGPRKSRVQAAFSRSCSRPASARVAVEPGSRAPASCATPRASSTANAMCWWPTAFRCIRSVSMTSAMVASRIRHMSTSVAPCRSLISRDELVEDRHPAAHGSVDAAAAGVEDREHHDVGAAGGQAADGFVVPRGEVVEVDPRAQHVVGAGVDADQVGAQGEGRLDLLVEDLAAACVRGSRGWRSRSSATRRGAAPRRPGRPSRAARWAGPGRGRRRPR